MAFPSSLWRAGLAPVLILPLVVVPTPVTRASGTAGPVMRVLLRSAPVLALGANSTRLALQDRSGRRLLDLAPGETLRLQQTPAGLMAQFDAGQRASQRVLLPEQEVWLDPISTDPSASTFSLDQRRFRGRLRIRRSDDQLQAVNYIGLESYLPSVVGGEMPASWPKEALRAQAVAARTYALRQRRPSADFDLKATVSSQVYKGLASETPSTWDAVTSTQSQVLMHGDQLIEAVFHSSSGGITENSGELWKNQVPYLVSVPDFDEHSPVSQWVKRFSPADLREAFPETGGVSELSVLATSSSGRVRQVKVKGPKGSLQLDGTALRRRLDLRSTLVHFRLEPPDETPRLGPLPRLLSATLPSLPFLPVTSSGANQTTPMSSSLPMPGLVVEGRGFGHGVGMSQWGAHGLAQQGKGYAQILSHYYRGTKIQPFQ